MIITSDIFEAYLKCPYKCWFRFRGEQSAGNIYSHWVWKQNHLYWEEALNRILDDIGVDDFTSSPAQPLNIKMAKWRLAADVVVRKEDLEANVPAIEQLSSESKRVQQYGYLNLILVPSGDSCQRPGMMASRTSLRSSNVSGYWIM